MAFVGSLGGFVLGYDSGVISGALLFLRHIFALTALKKEVMVSSFLVGAMVGSFFAGRLADRYGRKPALITASLGSAFFSLWLGMAPNYITFLVARLAIGIAVGIIVVTGPMFTAEFSRAVFRGRASGSFQLAVALGLMSAYWGDYLLARVANWHAMFFLGVVPSLLLAMMMLLLSDTPRFYMLKGNESKAREALSHLYPTEERVSLEVRSIASEIEIGVKSKWQAGWRGLLAPGVRKAFWFGMIFSVFEQLTGIKSVTYYSPTIFVLAGFAKSSALLITAFIGIVTVLATVAGLFLVDHLGRRKLTLFSLFGMGVAMVVLAYAFLQPNKVGAVAVMLALAVMGYHVFYSLGMGLMGWVLVPEIFPNRIRARGQALAKTANWIAGFFVAMTFLSITQSLGPSATFGLFALIIASGFVYVYRYAPETKGKPLEEVEQFWFAQEHGLNDSMTKVQKHSS